MLNKGIIRVQLDGFRCRSLEHAQPRVAAMVDGVVQELPEPRHQVYLSSGGHHRV